MQQQQQQQQQNILTVCPGKLIPETRILGLLWMHENGKLVPTPRQFSFQL